MDCGDMVEIFIDSDTISLKKWNTELNIMDQVGVLHDTAERMEKELKDTKELEAYLKRVRNKLAQLQKELVI